MPLGSVRMMGAGVAVILYVKYVSSFLHTKNDKNI